MKKSIYVFVIALLLTLSLACAALAAGGRLCGSTREYTAAEISRDGWPEGCDKVVLVNGYSFADAVAAGPLAKALNAPVLLTGKGALHEAAAAEIRRLGADKVYIVGGEDVVPPEAADAAGVEVERVAGRDRYETAAAVAQKIKALGVSFDEVVLVRSDDFPDALAVSAVQQVVPVLFAGKAGDKNLNYTTAKLLASMDINNIYVAGGSDVVSDTAVAQAHSIIGADKPDPARMSGDSRYDTAIAVAGFFKTESGYQGAVLATGNNFADALAAAPYAAKKGYALILVNGKAENPLPDSARGFIRANRSIPFENIVALGGQPEVPDKAIEAAKQAASGVMDDDSPDVVDWQ